MQEEASQIFYPFRSLKKNLSHFSPKKVLDEEVANKIGLKGLTGVVSTTMEAASLCPELVRGFSADVD